MKNSDIGEILARHHFIRLSNEDKSIDVLTISRPNLMAAIREIINKTTMKFVSSKPDKLQLGHIFIVCKHKEEYLFYIEERNISWFKPSYGFRIKTIL